MNYIGSKQKLAPWIMNIVKDIYPTPLSEAIFADIFAGTGQVARNFKKHVKQVIVNDMENYSFALNRHYIGNTQELSKPEIQVNPSEGVIFRNFSPSGDRMYYTEDNAQLIDGIRNEIERKLQTKEINDDQYYWLIASLIEAADAVANTASVYGAFLKQFKKTAQQKLNFSLVPYEITKQNNLVFKENANDLIKKISGDILYLDPPYNERQYGANYHVLNRIVDNTEFTSDKKTGIGEYNKSNYCKKNTVYNEFEELIKNAQFKYIFISYNNEGLINEAEFQEMLKKYGHYELHQKEYKRFKADAKRPNQAETTYEHLHVLIKD